MKKSVGCKLWFLISNYTNVSDADFHYVKSSSKYMYLDFVLWPLLKNFRALLCLLNWLLWSDSANYLITFVFSLHCSFLMMMMIIIIIIIIFFLYKKLKNVLLFDYQVFSYYLFHCFLGWLCWVLSCSRTPLHL